MTSAPVTYEGFSLEDLRFTRLYKVANSIFRQALYLVFKWGCKKNETESIIDYLMKKGMSRSDIRRRMTGGMKQTVVNDPSGKTYDVTLLWTCIRWGCDDLDENKWREGEENVESLCTTVKNHRNRIFHGEVHMFDETEMNAWCTEVTMVLEKLLILAGLKYYIPDHDVLLAIQDIKEQITIIMKAPLGDVMELQKEVLELREAKKTINERGKNELSERYKDTSKIDSESFVTGKERLHVENVFTKLEVICDSKGESWYKTNDIEYNKILKVKTEEGKDPAIIILEGDAGAGKTKLSKLIVSDWAEGSSRFEGLKDYDLVLYGEERNRHISSYLELIQILMPETSNKLADDDLVRSILQLKVLVVMDGFDELNAESEKLTRELLEKQIPQSSGKLQLLITSRPEKVPDLIDIVEPHSVVHTKLPGIAINRLFSHVHKQKDLESRKLIEFMKQSQSRLGDHYCLPHNLTLLTDLWASDLVQYKINLETTVTGLYIAFFEFFQDRLLLRLQSHRGVANLSKVDYKEEVGEFLQELYKVCLDTLSSGSMQLSEPSTKALEEKCEKLRLPFYEMARAFLTVEQEWTSNGYKTYLIVPHKSFMEFYAAKRFMTYIRHISNTSSQKDDVMPLLKRMKVPEEGQKEIKKIINKYTNPEYAKSLKNICHKLLETDKDLTMYEMTFLHLAGLDVPEEGKEEMQRIINKYSNHKDAKSLKKICHKLLKTDKDLTAYEKMLLHLTCLDVPEEGKEDIKKIINKYSNPTDAESHEKLCHAKFPKTDKDLTVYEVMFLHLTCLDVPEEGRKEVQRIINQYSNTEDAKSLIRICHKRLQTDKDLTMYENVFLYLTGLLAHHCPNMLQEYAQELVEILRNAGFQGTKWLDVLVEAKCDEKLAGLLAPIYSENLIVRDGHMGAALVLFKHLKTNTPVKIILENEVPYIPQLEDMLRQLSRRDCNVEISSNHQWKNQECGSSHDPLSYVLHEEDEDHKCKVISFTGHLKTLSCLPKSLKKLCITFATTDHAQQILKELPDLMKNNYIEYLGIHVMPAVQPDGLSPLPGNECTILWLSQVADDLKAKCEVIQALLPLNGMFDFLMFPQSNFSADQCGEIISELCRLKVKVSKRGGLCFSSSVIKDKELSQLQHLARDELGCELCCMDESYIW